MVQLCCPHKELQDSQRDVNTGELICDSNDTVVQFLAVTVTLYFAFASVTWRKFLLVSWLRRDTGLSTYMEESASHLAASQKSNDRQHTVHRNMTEADVTNHVQ